MFAGTYLLLGDEWEGFESELDEYSSKEWDSFAGKHHK
jgi:hypothetical protein